VTKAEDEKLSAYMDRELPAEESAKVAAEAAATPETALRLARFRRADRLLEQAAKQPELEDDPLADRLRNHSPGAKPVRRNLTWTIVGGGALAAGLTLGHWVVPSSEMRITLDKGAVARGVVAATLEHKPSGVADGKIAVTASFRNAAGRFCRYFTVSDIGALACRDEGHWRILALEQGRKPVQGYQTAAGGEGLIEAKLESPEMGDVLDAVEEKQAIATRWRR